MMAANLPWLGHAHGGTITKLIAIAHDTDRRVGYWEYIGRVEWRDGTVSEEARISPSCLCYDETEVGGHARVCALSKQLTEYLDRNGTWHDRKHTRDGRMYEWTPHQPKGREPIIE